MPAVLLEYASDAVMGLLLSALLHPKDRAPDPAPSPDRTGGADGLIFILQKERIFAFITSGVLILLLLSLVLGKV